MALRTIGKLASMMGNDTIQISCPAVTPFDTISNLASVPTQHSQISQTHPYLRLSILKGGLRATSTATMLQHPTIRGLPTEILLIIAHHLDIFSLIRLRCSCCLFREIIPSPTHLELIPAETTEFATENDLYACRDCLRLRPRAKFADNMVKKKRAKWGCNCSDRFCVDCGISPRPGTQRYNPGNFVVVQGKTYVICLRCRKLGASALDGNYLPVCQDCRPFTRTINQHNETERVRGDRVRREPWTWCQICVIYELGRLKTS